jgi:hypothetical protein
MCWATFRAIFSQTHLVTLIPGYISSDRSSQIRIGVIVSISAISLNVSFGRFLANKILLSGAQCYEHFLWQFLTNILSKIGDALGNQYYDPFSASGIKIDLFSSKKSKIFLNS